VPIVRPRPHRESAFVTTASDAPAVASSGFRHAFSALHHRDFAVFWSAAAVSNSGSWMQTITVPYVVYALTRSTAWVGFTAFVMFLPGVLAGPASGAIADRFSRRAVLLVTTGVQTAVALALWGLWVSGVASPGNLLAVLVVSSIAGNINITAWQSFVPSLVPPDALVGAVRLNSVQFTAARAVGPALGGAVLARFGPSVAFMANAVSFGFVIAALVVVRPRPTPVAPRGASIMRQFAEGVRYMRRQPAMWQPVVTILIVSFLPSALVQLAPAFAEEQFHTSQAGYGLLVAAYGVGSVLGSVGIAAHADRGRRSAAALVGIAGQITGVVIVAATTSLPVGLVGLCVMGASYVTVTISLNTSIQVRVDEVFRGRAVSLYLMAMLTGLPLGALALGWVANGIGLRPTTLLTAGLLACYAAVVATRLGALRAID
jgi:MFS family permease